MKHIKTGKNNGKPKRGKSERNKRREDDRKIKPFEIKVVLSSNEPNRIIYDSRDEK